MKEFLSQFIKTDCEVIVEQENLIDVLTVLADHRVTSNMSLEVIDWYGGSRWSVKYEATGKRHSLIKKALTEKAENFKEILIVTNTNTFVKVEPLWKGES